MLSQSKIRQSFQRALNSYNDSALVQQECAAKLVKHLLDSGISTSLTRAFEFGCGTGFLTQSLTERLKIKELFTNDIVKECQAYLPLTGTHFIAGDVEDIVIPDKCELICSASCVQWSTDLPSLLNRLGHSLVDQGYLAISSFDQGHFKELELLNTQQGSQIKQTLNYWPAQLWRQQLKPSYHVELIIAEEITLWFDSVRQLLLHLRRTGVNGNAGQSWSQQNLSKFEHDYRHNFEANGKVPLSYKPIYIIARKRSQ